ncbi:MAG: acyltransferase [Gammaproteobacteria bacterium]|nr:acyltransferase [Gammaproteobacteria bacterium]MBU1969718.1 acyltransferase [Gammaproteobacteria bacterium]
MSIDQRTSHQIEALRFPLIVGVVFIHMGANYSDVILDSPESSLFAYKFVIHLISLVVLSSVVPLFFVISSYLLFVRFTPTFDSYLGKLRSRMTSLLAPYLIWNLTYLAFKFVVQTNLWLASMTGGTSKRIVDYQFTDYFDALTGISNFPISYQFWFIRDLIVMVLFAPAIWWAIRRFSWLPVICFMVIWMIDQGRLANIRNESWFFFSLGCLVAQGKLDVQMQRVNQLWLLAVYVVLAISTTFLFVSGVQFFPILSKLVTLAGVAAIWYASDLIFREGVLGEYAKKLSVFSFFVFAAHEPLLGIAAKVAGKLLYDQGGGSCVCVVFQCANHRHSFAIDVGGCSQVAYPTVLSKDYRWEKGCASQ